MATSRAPLNFNSAENEILLNPRWPKEDYRSLEDLAKWAQAKESIQAHVWLATSGSTAESVSAIKLVALSKTALLNSARAVNDHLQASEKDIWTQVLPQFHVGGLGIEVRAYLSGARVVRALNRDRWDAHHFLKTVGEQRCTLSALVPTQLYDLVKAGYRAPAALRALIIGGGPLSEELYAKARQLGWPVLPSYGMTETASQIATALLNSLSSPEFPSLSLLSHAEVQTSPAGFLQVKASSLLSFYAQNLENEKRVWDPKQNGWFTTEDQGEITEGRLHVSGRSRDYIKIGGEATNLAHLRSLLESTAMSLNKSWPHKVTLLDSPSERLGSEIHLISQLSAEESAQVEKAFAEKVLPFERVRQTHFVDQIPRSELGKILWGELRKLL